MREFQDKKRLRKLLYSKLSVWALLIMILFFAHATWKVYQKSRASAAYTAQAEISLKKLKDRQNVLTSELSRLDTEEGVEEEIRAKYGVSKPGEEMVIIVDARAATSTKMQPEAGWWNKFKKLFK